MEIFSDQDELRIRAECRNKYRDEGNTDSAYKFGTMNALIWESEATRIFKEGMESL